jgi:tRNA dimethylallyltransferase
LRYNCCFICLDAELEEVDKYVNDRVDNMMQAGLLDEISEFYAPDAKFTRGLHQAIGVREFSSLFSKIASELEEQCIPMSGVALKTLLEEQRYSDMVSDAVTKMKANTRRLVRVQVLESL